MELKLHSNDSIRITTGNNFKKNFIDVTGEPWQQAIGISFLSSETYFEVRKKDGLIKCFYFENEGDSNDFDFKWWEDAKVIFTNNDAKVNI